MTKPLPKRDLEAQEAINRVARSIYETGFVYARDDRHRPRRGTLMYQLWHGKKLSARHAEGWYHFTCDLHEARGKSGPVTSGYGDSVTSRTPSDFKEPLAFSNAQYRRLERLFSLLDPFERVILRDLMADELQVKGALNLEAMGFCFNAYKNADQARAAAVGKLTYLMDRLAAFYSL